jgi:DHA3 family macrolide efflux protein-like MFS transporter
MRVSRGLRIFVTIWFGQVISLVGSGLTSFALGLWVYERTGSVTRFALIALSSVLPALVFAPLAGALVDRWDRRRVMMLSDTGAGLSTLLIVALLSAGRLEVWHIYLTSAVGAVCGTFQRPAYFAAIPLLVPKRHLGRTAGMVQIAQAASDVFAPLLAGLLLGVIRMQGVLLVDVITFLFAVSTLLAVRFPAPAPSPAPAAALNPNAARSLLNEIASGWAYIAARPGLVGLLVFFAITNFLIGMIGALLVPLVLTITNARVLGAMISVAGSGMLLGSVLMSVWGGPQRRIRAVLGFQVLIGLGVVLIGLRPSVLLIVAGASSAHFAIPIVTASNQAIWQSKVPASMQGRVFATQHMVARLAVPLAFLSVGPLADAVCEPLMAKGGALAPYVGSIIGTGTGRGMALIFVVAGGVMLLATAAASVSPRIQRVEEELTDAALPGDADSAVQRAPGGAEAPAG